MDDLDALKDRACSEVDALSADLVALGRRIFEHPEFQFEERQACAWLTEFIRAAGFAVEGTIAGMETRVSRDGARVAGRVPTSCCSPSTTPSAGSATRAATT